MKVLFFSETALKSFHVSVNVQLRGINMNFSLMEKQIMSEDTMTDHVFQSGCSSGLAWILEDGCWGQIWTKYIKKKRKKSWTKQLEPAVELQHLFKHVKNKVLRFSTPALCAGLVCDTAACLLWHCSHQFGFFGRTIILFWKFRGPFKTWANIFDQQEIF